MAGETTVGSIVGFLRLDASQFHREIEQAITAADYLDSKDVDVKVRADTTGAAAKLEATAAQVDKIDKSNVRVEKSSVSAGKGLGAMATAIITLGPALVPVATGAAGLGAAFGGMGAAGILAIVGIRDEMQRGTAVGLAYQGGVNDVKASMMDLAGIAAGNVLGSFQRTIGELDAAMPGLRTQIGELSTVTGSAASNLAGGLLSAFQALGPVMRDVSIYVETLTSRFQDAMSGPGVVAFGDYIRSVFPQVVQSLESIVGAAIHLVQALAPLGLGTLSTLKMLADVISAIPVDVLSTLATLAGGVFIGFRAWQGLSALIGGVSTAMEFLGVKATTAAMAVRGLQAAAGVIGVVLAGLSIAMTVFSSDSAAAKQATNDFTDALIASNGALDANVTATAAKKLMDEGALTAASQLGISQKLVTDAVIGVSGAQQELTRQMDAFNQKQIAAQQGADGTTQKMADQNNAMVVLQGVVGDLSGKFTDAAQSQRDYAAATAQTKGNTDNLAIAAQNLANTYGTSAANYQAVITGQQGVADKAAQATLKMQLENDAAGLLKQSLDALSGKTISAAQAQNTFDSQLANMGDHVDKTGKKIHFTTTSINNMSAASVELRGQLLGQITSAQQTAEAYGQMKGSAEEGRQKLIELRKKIIDNAVAHGIDKKAVQEYVDQFLKIPKSVPPTKLQIDTAEALRKKKALQDAIYGLTGKTVTITIQQVYKTFGQQAAVTLHNDQTLARHGILNANGSLTLSNGVRAMAEGGFTGSRDSMIQRATKPIVWNEAPGGEAYISLAPQKRRRSQAIWEQTGDLIGATRGGGTTQHNTFNINGGASPKAIIRELDWSL